jgi:hypothetical protein
VTTRKWVRMQVRKTFEAQRACIMQTREWMPGSKPKGRALLKHTWLSVSVDCGRSMSPATNLQLGSATAFQILLAQTAGIVAKASVEVPGLMTGSRRGGDSN